MTPLFFLVDLVFFFIFKFIDQIYIIYIYMSSDLGVHVKIFTCYSLSMPSLSLLTFISLRVTFYIKMCHFRPSVVPL